MYPAPPAPPTDILATSQAHSGVKQALVIIYSDHPKGALALTCDLELRNDAPDPTVLPPRVRPYMVAAGRAVEHAMVGIAADMGIGDENVESWTDAQALETMGCEMGRLLEARDKQARALYQLLSTMIQRWPELGHSTDDISDLADILGVEIWTRHNPQADNEMRFHPCPEGMDIESESVMRSGDDMVGFERRQPA